jgi:hypothetical protein
MISRATFISFVTIIAFYATGSALWHYKCTQERRKAANGTYEFRQPLLRSSSKSVNSFNDGVCVQPGIDNRNYRIARTSRALSEEQLVSIGQQKIDLNEEYLNIQLKYWIGAGTILFGILVATVCCYYRFCCMICCCCKRKRQLHNQDNETKSTSIPSVASDPKSTSATIASDSCNSQNDIAVMESEENLFNSKKLPWWSNTSSVVN